MTFVSSRAGLFASVALFCCSVPDGAAAQDVSATDGAPQAHDPDEIVVSAQRRDQALSDVGISVSVLSSNAIAEHGITSASDLAKIVPGFTAADSALNVPLYTLRGVGFNDGSLGANAAVGVYVNEIPLAYPAMTQGAVLDLERIEVLKGPQGTLYGQNSTGGTINYISNKPSDTFEAGIDVTASRFDTMRGQAYVSGPLSKTVRARIAADFALGGDWQRSISRPGDELGQVERGSFRALLNWEPSDRVSVDLDLNGWYDKSDTQALQLIRFTPARPANVPRLPQVFNSPFAGNNARDADWTPGLDYGRDDRFGQAGLKIGYELSDAIRLTSISSYSDYKGNALLDRDGMAAVNFEARVKGTIKSWYQELRLSGDTDELFWSFGGNYRHDKIRDLQDTSIREGTSTVGAYRRTPVTANQQVETYAVFADGEFDIASTISLVGGVRYTEDRRDFAGCTADSGAGDLAAFFSPIVNSLRAARGLAPLPATAPGACVTLDANLVPGLQEKRLVENNVSYHAGINWKPAPRTLVYATISQGYKAGAFATLGSTTEVQLRPVKQEKLIAYEIGAKTSPLGSLLQLNAAAFYYDYTNKQQRGRIIDPTFGGLSTLVNVPKSRIYGAEVEASLRPVQGLTLYASYLYLNTKITEFTGINFSNQVEDFAGDALNFSPKHSVNAGGSYERDVSSNLTAFVGADYSYRSATSAFFGNVAGQEIKDYQVVDLRAGIRNDDAGWKVSVFGNNVLNEYYWNNVIRGTDGIARAAARPATYGIQFGFKY
ncbi:TonB-dependent receptor [Novosphingobium resinovorum]|uniref:TonB-dependent receptor n=1 Tax=Novosphingobium resinovorum TaxID=158500 RepID=A0A031JZD1_9SPHN|nr:MULTISPECIES: TonB-dependent receptor [Novosphingobium]EZP83101.1 TonB-dependent receptor [Novosphingobium resinovorum]